MVLEMQHPLFKGSMEYKIYDEEYVTIEKSVYRPHIKSSRGINSVKSYIQNRLRYNGYHKPVSIKVVDTRYEVIIDGITTARMYTPPLSFPKVILDETSPNIVKAVHLNIPSYYNGFKIELCPTRNVHLVYRPSYRSLGISSQHNLEYLSERSYSIMSNIDRELLEIYPDIRMVSSKFNRFKRRLNEPMLELAFILPYNPSHNTIYGIRLICSTIYNITKKVISTRLVSFNL